MARSSSLSLQTTDVFARFQLKVQEVIDQGMCGDVLLVTPRYKPEKKLVVKRFILLDEDKKEKHMEIFQAEMKFMQSFEHPYLMKCIFTAQCTGYNAICMQYYRRGTLHNYISVHSHKLSERNVIQVACALRYMHNRHVAHLDVKVDNIFLDADFNAVLGDFGLAQELMPDQQTLPRIKCGGTTSYFAPERTETAEHYLNPYKLDSYSLGVVLWSMILRRDADDDINYYMEVVKEQDLPSHVRGWLLDLLERDPIKRPIITEFLTKVREDGHYHSIIDNN